MIHEKNKRGLRFKLTIKIDTSYGMSFLTEFSIAPKLQMDSIIPFKKRNYLGLINQDKLEDGFQRNLVWFRNVGDHKYSPGPFITSKEFGVFKLISSVYMVSNIRRYALVQLIYLSPMLYVITWGMCRIVYRLPVS